MLTQAQKTEYIAKIAQLPRQVETLIAGLSVEQLLARPLPGEWSAAQNVHHLFDSHANSYIRCKLMATEENPPLKPYDQEQWAAFVDGSEADVTTSLALLKGLHKRWVSFWQNLPEASWQRTGTHPEAGVVTLERQLIAYAEHGEAHLRQISEVLAAQGIERTVPAALDRSFQPRNREETLRLRALLTRFSEADLEKSVSHGWTIKATLVHLAFYDLRALVLIDEFEQTGVRQSPMDIDSINEVVRQMADSISGAAAVEMWTVAAEALDQRIDRLPDSMVAAIIAAGSPFQLPRYKHRAEHREEIEKVLGTV